MSSVLTSCKFKNKPNRPAGHFIGVSQIAIDCIHGTTPLPTAIFVFIFCKSNLMQFFNDFFNDVFLRIILTPFFHSVGPLECRFLMTVIFYISTRATIQQHTNDFQSIVGSCFTNK